MNLMMGTEQCEDVGKTGALREDLSGWRADSLELFRSDCVYEDWL
jgi:hypothetical protein